MQLIIYLPEDTTKAKLKRILPKTKLLCKYAAEVYIEYVAYLQQYWVFNTLTEYLDVLNLK